MEEQMQQQSVQCLITSSLNMLSTNTTTPGKLKADFKGLQSRTTLDGKHQWKGRGKKITGWYSTGPNDPFPFNLDTWCRPCVKRGNADRTTQTLVHERLIILLKHFLSMMPNLCKSNADREQHMLQSTYSPPDEH